MTIFGREKTMSRGLYIQYTIHQTPNTSHITPAQHKTQTNNRLRTVRSEDTQDTKTQKQRDHNARKNILLR